MASTERRSVVMMAPFAAAPVATAAATAWWPLTPATAAALSHLLTSLGIFVICCAAAAFLIASIPAALAMAQAATRFVSVTFLVHSSEPHIRIRAERIMRVVEAELPESAALMRLSGMEVTECLSEVSSLGADLSAGIRCLCRGSGSKEEE